MDIVDVLGPRMQRVDVTSSLVIMCIPPVVYVVGFALTVIFNTKARITRTMPDDGPANDGMGMGIGRAV